MPDTLVTLGDFVFQDTEVPEQIPFGGEQHLVLHRMIGGARVIDALGPDPVPMTWEGLFLGPDALDRALYLDGLRIAGQPLLLAWSELAYMVIIRAFVCPFQRFYQLPYSITVEVVEDLTAKPAEAPGLSLDDAINQDMNSAMGFGTLIGDSGISDALATLQTAVQAVNGFAKAAKSTLNSVLMPLATVQKQVQTLISSTNNTLANVTTLGGILPGNPVSQNVSKLLGQAASMTQLHQLHGLNNVLGRMGANLNLSMGTNRQTVGGGNLFGLAQQHYGDASQWATIAQANNLTDPQVNGIQTLTIPAVAADNGGILTP